MSCVWSYAYSQDVMKAFMNMSAVWVIIFKRPLKRHHQFDSYVSDICSCLKPGLAHERQKQKCWSTKHLNCSSWILWIVHCLAQSILCTYRINNHFRGCQ